MQIKKKNNKKIILIVIIAILLIAGGVTAAVVVHNNQQSQKTEQSDEDSKNKKGGNNNPSDKDDDSKDAQSDNNDSQSNKDSNQSVTDDKTPPRYEGGSVQNSDTLTGSVNSVSIANSTMVIRVTIDQLVNDSNGTCSLNLAGPNGQTYAEQAKMIDNPQTSTCYGWDIPTSKLGFTNGTWKVTVHLSGGGKTGTLTKEINL